MWCDQQIQMKGCSPCNTEKYSGVKRIMDPLLTYTHTYTLMRWSTCSSSDTTFRISWSGTSAAKFPRESDWQHSCLYSPSSPWKQRTATLLHSSTETGRLSVVGWPWLDSRSQSTLLYHSARQRSENTAIAWTFHRVTASSRHPPALLWSPPWTADGSLLPYGPPWAAGVSPHGLQRNLFWYLEQLLFCFCTSLGVCRVVSDPPSLLSLATVVQDFPPFPNCVIPEALPPLLIGPVITSSRSVLEAAGIGSVRHRETSRSFSQNPPVQSFSTKNLYTNQLHHPTQWSC